MSNITLNHDISREVEVQQLVQGIMNARVEFWDNPNGAYENTCPFCGVVERRGSLNPYASMHELNHEADCTYLIAKGLKISETDFKNLVCL